METRLNNYSENEITDQFGPIEHYNVLLFDSIIAEMADCEGALAVAGDALLCSKESIYPYYDIGGANMNMADWESKYIGLYENPMGYPSFVLGGKVDPESAGSKVYNGSIVLRESYKEDFAKGPFRFEIGTINYTPDEMVDVFFEKASSQIMCTSEKLFSVSGNEISSHHFRWFSELDLEEFVVPNLYKDKKVAVLNYKPESGKAIWNEMYIDDTFWEYDLVVINIDAKMVEFKTGAFVYFDGATNHVIQLHTRNKPDNLFIREISSRLVFNCPNTESIDFNRVAVYASVIAPKANIAASGGSINGMIIANSLRQKDGFEPHAFTIALGAEFWLPCNPIVKIIKRDSAIEEKKLAGAVFDLYQYDVSAETYELLLHGLTTSPDGTLILVDLDKGNYKLVETTPPRGYQLPSQVETLFEI